MLFARIWNLSLLAGTTSGATYYTLWTCLFDTACSTSRTVVPPCGGTDGQQFLCFAYPFSSRDRVVVILLPIFFTRAASSLRQYRPGLFADAVSSTSPLGNLELCSPACCWSPDELLVFTTSSARSPRHEISCLKMSLPAHLMLLYCCRNAITCCLSVGGNESIVR